MRNLRKKNLKSSLFRDSLLLRKGHRGNLLQRVKRYKGQ
jgi:hypothetical protein